MEATPVFPSTCWSRLIARDSGTHRPDLETLAQAYWRPVHAWLRLNLRGGAEDAADVAQDFFVWMMQSDFLERADPARGRFRAYLRTALRHFVIDRRRRERTQKHGGHARHRPLHDSRGEPLELPAPELEPDAALDAAWRAELVQRATEVLEQELALQDKAVYFRIFHDYYLTAAPELDHRALAERHRLGLDDVSNHLRYAKKLYRALLRRQVMETVASSEDLDEELRWLFSEVRP
jgi:RNA polymerase sigma-70 factor (ECF subfamily)